MNIFPFTAHPPRGNNSTYSDLVNRATGFTVNVSDKIFTVSTALTATVTFLGHLDTSQVLRGPSSA